MSSRALPAPSAPGALRQPRQRTALRYYASRFWKFKLGLAAIVVLVLLYVAAFLGPYLLSRSPNELSFLETLQGPSLKHWLGTDDTGRDVFTRLIYGGRVSLFASAFAVLISATVGVVLGAIAGYYGGFVDAAVMRCTDALLAIPTFLLLLVVLSIFGSSLTHLVVAIGLTSWMTVTRLVRSDFLRYREAEFVLAANALGASNARIIFRHILPEVISPVIVAGSTLVGSIILLESALSYLGLGVQPPSASWGNMLSNAQSYMWTQPMLAVYPGIAIVIAVVAFNYSGEALRRALNAREG